MGVDFTIDREMFGNPILGGKWIAGPIISIDLLRPCTTSSSNQKIYGFPAINLSPYYN